MSIIPIVKTLVVVAAAKLCLSLPALAQAQRPDIVLLTQTADFVVKYGFLAVGFVLVTLVAPALYKFAGAIYLTLASAVFGLAFIVAYGVINLITVVRPEWISSQRVIISGTVFGVPSNLQVQMKSDLWRPGRAYTKREFHPERSDAFNVPFIFVTAHAPSCLAVALESSSKDSEESVIFNVTPVSAEDMAPSLDFLAEVMKENGVTVLKVWREVAGKQRAAAEIFRPLGLTQSGCTTILGRMAQGWGLLSVAIAQSSQVDIEARLQSDDVFTRRDARIELSKAGVDAFPLIEKFLGRKDSYRLQLGAVTALASMPREDRIRAPPSTLEALKLLRSYPDKTMRENVMRALQEQ